MTRTLIIFILSALMLVSCRQDPATQETSQHAPQPTDHLHDAKRFAIRHEGELTILEIFGNKDNHEVTSTFVLYRGEKPNYNANAWYVKVPVKRVASMSSVYSLMLMALGEGQSIAAIDRAEYYTDTFIRKGVQEGRITELSKGANIEVEKTLALKPDLLLTFGMGNPGADLDDKLIKAKVPVAISLDHLEETPLARAEWIKFYACFFGKERQADSIFSRSEKHYLELKQLVNGARPKPTILTEIKYGDTWYVPAGRSYMANLMADAGGDYFWKDNDQSGSTPLSFEAVYAKAKDCDVWINTYNLNSKQELLAYDKRYGLFKAFRENRIYNNNKVQNVKGYSNYWETAMLQPDAVLADLIAILYPDRLPGHVFTYYKKLE